MEREKATAQQQLADMIRASLGNHVLLIDVQPGPRQTSAQPCTTHSRSLLHAGGHSSSRHQRLSDLVQ
jgi:hypothetical protein